MDGWMGGRRLGQGAAATAAAATAAAAVGISVYPAWPARRLTVSLPLLFVPERCGVAAVVHLLSWRSADMTERGEERGGVAQRGGWWGVWGGI